MQNSPFLFRRIPLDKQKLIKTMIQLVAIILIIFLLYHCPFSFFLGISCPGCGMTRAFLSLLQFDFAQAFYYHPLFPLVIALVLLYCLYRLHLISLSKKTIAIIEAISLFAFFFTYIIRLLLRSPVVAWDFEQAAIVKLFRFLSNLFT